jgi:hypothetical protein
LKGEKMLNSEVAAEVSKELAKSLNETLEKLSKKYGNLIIKIDIVQIKKKAASLKIGVVTKEGKVIIPVDQYYVMAGDTINLTFPDRKFQLKDIIKTLTWDFS